MARRARRVLWPALAAVVVAGALFLTLFPTRTWLDQRGAIADSRAELGELDAELAELDARVAALDSPEEVERLAREEYGMVMPGEEAYRILPRPAPPVEIPPGWPFTAAPPADDSAPGLGGPIRQ